MSHVTLIANSVLGAELSADEQEIFAQVCTDKRLSHEEILFNAGEKGDNLYVITEGKIEVIKNLGLKDETIIATLSAGALAGELSFIDGEEYSMTLRSRRDSEVLILNRSDFESLVENHPQVVYKVMRAILRSSHKLQRKLNAQFMEMNRFVTNQYM